MLLLILASAQLQTSGRMAMPTQNGVLFWSSIYIPIAVAMAASQNVRAAVSGGTTAMVAGAVVVVVSFTMVPWISRIGQVELDSRVAASSTEPNDMDRAGDDARAISGMPLKRSSSQDSPQDLDCGRTSSQRAN